MKDKSLDSDKKEFLKRDRKLKRWFDNNAKERVVTADIDVWKLMFSNKIGKSPAEFVSLDKVEMENITAEFLADLENIINPATKKKYIPTYVAGYPTAIKAWTEMNRNKFEGKISVSNLNSRPAFSDFQIQEIISASQIGREKEKSYFRATLPSSKIVYFAIKGCTFRTDDA